VPLEGLDGGRESSEQWIGSSCRRELHVGEAHFWAGHQRHASAHGSREQLMTQAHTQKWLAQRDDPLANRSLFGAKPGVQVFLPDGRQPSRSVLEKIARALSLTRRESAVLFELAGLAASYPENPVRTPGPGVLHLLECLPDASIAVQDAKLDVIAWNPLVAALFGDLAALPDDRKNLARRFFLERPGEAPHFSLIGGEERYEAYLVARLRQAAARYPTDRETRRLIDDLTISERFRELWDSNEVYTPERHLVKTTEHPRVGRMELDCVVLHVPEDDQEVVMLTAKPGSVSAARLRALSAA
jgi:hypothetical protein